jgi:hypothetical protein
LFQSPTPASDLCLEPYVSNLVSTENYVTTLDDRSIP